MARWFSGDLPAHQRRTRPLLECAPLEGHTYNGVSCCLRLICAQLWTATASCCERSTFQLPTAEVAVRVGRILEIDKLLPSSKIPTVQSLRPRQAVEAKQNQYSGHYGFDIFPFHTDLAHWALPPRYFLLRCLIGTEDVFTNVLPSSHVVGLLSGLPAEGGAQSQKAPLCVFRLVRALCSITESKYFGGIRFFLSRLMGTREPLCGPCLTPL